ncbi:MAG: cysteine--tRNA ligase, partial [Dehalococcoidia bacterium]|nr:cysteine--tRNA ligase [Dehalococcoidia bacterium]
VLNSYYRGPNNLTEDAMAASIRAIERLAGALEPSTGDGESVDGDETRRRFIEAMEDDLGTPAALAALFDLARAINRGRDEARDVTAAQATLRELAEVLGLQLHSSKPASDTLDAVALSKLAANLEVVCSGTDVDSTVEALIERRTAARGERNFALADQIRDELAVLDVILEDTADGTRWSARG